MTRWFISDLHLGDHRLLKRRYSKTVDQMDAHIASRWDGKVRDEDEVWVLGDVARGRSQEYLRDWFSARPGRKRLVLGNWDEPKHAPWNWVEIGFEKVCRRAHIPLGEGAVVLSHYPYGHRLNPEEPRTLLHGHTHSPKKVKRSSEGHLMIHVGWDARRTLITEEQILEEIEKEQE